MQLVCPGVVIDVHKQTCMPNHVPDLRDVEDETLHDTHKQRQLPLLCFALDFLLFCKRRPPPTGKHVFRVFGFCVLRPKLSGIRALGYGTSLCGAKSRCLVHGALSIMPHGAACLVCGKGGGGGATNPKGGI